MEISDKILLNTNARYYKQEQVHTAERFKLITKRKKQY